MRAVRTIDGEVRCVDVAAPEPGAGEVVVDIAAAGICGSDLHMLGFGLTATFGHECAGRLADGTPVAIQPIVHCGDCDRCLADQSHLCRTAGGTMYGLGRDGGMADAIVVDESCLVPLPDGLSVADACLVEPLAVAQHAANTSGVEQGQRVLVVGGGMIGLACVATFGAAGADVDLGSSVVVDAAGTSSAVATAIDHARPGGLLSAPAVYWDPLTIPNAVTLVVKEVRVQPSYTYGHHHGVREVDEAAALLGIVPELAGAVVTHRFGLDDAPEAFRVAADRASGAIKVVLEP